MDGAGVQAGDDTGWAEGGCDDAGALEGEGDGSDEGGGDDDGGGGEDDGGGAGEDDGAGSETSTVPIHTWFSPAES